LGRTAMYSRSQNIGVKRITIIADSNWNQKDELRELASFITRIMAAIRNKNITIADRNRISFWKIESKKDFQSKEFHMLFIISQLHSSKLIAVWVNCPVSINL